MVTTALQVQPPPQQEPEECSNTFTSLAIVQLVLGILTIIFGIAAITTPFLKTVEMVGAGIWAGGVILLAGVTGVISCFKYNNGMLNGVYMAFSISSFFISVLASLFFSIFISINDKSNCYDHDRPKYCYYKKIRYGLNISLLIFMIVEFFVSITAIIFCCKRCCGRCGCGCCRGCMYNTYSVVQQSYVTYDAYGVARIMTANGGYVTNVQHPGQVVHQFGGHMQPQFTEQRTPQYGGQVLPSYTEYSNNIVPGTNQYNMHAL